MADIELVNILKKYNKVVALDNVSLSIKDNEFFVLFGPAGAGKTTMLKVIAGLEYADAGYVKIDGQIANHLEPGKRNVSMVFENYALYPHLSAYNNIASPMRSPQHRINEQEIKRRVEKIASLMKIDHLMARLPNQLSNGERQRVALGRCLVREPKVFLMDEPLAHLDAKLRHLMRAELKEMQAAFNTTTIYVTHDYMEALSLADRIGVINRGKIEQIGTGDELYYTPANVFVAKLIGEPEINILSADVFEDNGRIRVTIEGEKLGLYIDKDVGAVIKDKGYKKVDLGVRGNDLAFSLKSEADDCIKANVHSFEPIGNKTILIANTVGQQLKAVVPNNLRLEIDEEIYMKINLKNAIYFDAENGRFIGRHNGNALASGERNNAKADS